MIKIDHRILRATGSPREIGVAIGRHLGTRLPGLIARYIADRPGGEGTLDRDMLRKGAIPWLRRLPLRFLEEAKGMAEGANIDLQVIAEWEYVEMCISHSCSSLVCLVDGQHWVGSNNDSFVPDLWGYASIKEVDERIPSLGFGIEGGLFVPAGINRERLWLHMNGLPADDTPSGKKPCWPSWVLLTEALECCASLNDLENLLDKFDRSEGAMLTAVNGKTGECTIFECGRTKHTRREYAGDWMSCTNHYCIGEGPSQNPNHEHHPNSNDRYRRIDKLMTSCFQQKQPETPTHLIRVLAYDGVERRGETFATVHSCVACPALGDVWFTFGGYPSASTGHWHHLAWPWNN